MHDEDGQQMIAEVVAPLHAPDIINTFAQCRDYMDEIRRNLEAMKADLILAKEACREKQGTIERFMESESRLKNLTEEEWTRLLTGLSLGDVNDRPKFVAYDESYCLSRHDCKKMAQQLVRHFESTP
jgi:hypothetical protein